VRVGGTHVSGSEFRTGGESRGRGRRHRPDAESDRVRGDGGAPTRDRRSRDL